MVSSRDDFDPRKKHEIIESDKVETWVVGMKLCRAGWYQPDRTKIKTARGRWRYKHHIWNPAQQKTWVWASIRSRWRYKKRFTFTYPRGSWDWYPKGSDIMVYAETTMRLRGGHWKLT